MAKRAKRTFREIFLSKLKELSGEEQTLVGNTTLREALGWDEDRYGRVKKELVDENAIIVGRGRGGAVGLTNAPGTKDALSVFISYSHRDEPIKTELIRHLEPLRRLNLIDTWHDKKLKAGDEFDEVISNQLEKADIILLLVSIDFINSEYCFGIELDRALERHEKRDGRVVPVILRPCLWAHTRFAKLQALPEHGKPISTWNNQDEALTNIAEGVKIIADDLLKMKT